MRKKSKRVLLDQHNHGYVVAIDGPSGAGKSTVSRKLANVLGGCLLDTGGMYRAVAYFALNEKTKDEKSCGRLARSIRFSTDRLGETLLVNNEDLGARLRSEHVSQMASVISRYVEVRKVLTRKQRSLATRSSRYLPVVVEGRDIGTIVFPNAPFKFYVTAAPEVRARRRYQQLKKAGIHAINLKHILKQNEERDYRDSTREHAPLTCPEDAVIVDTSSMKISQVVKFMRDHIRGRLLLPNVEKT